MSAHSFTMLVDDKDIEHFGIRLINYEISSYISRKVKGLDISGAHGAKEVPSALATNAFLANIVCTGRNADEVQSNIRQFFAFMYSNQSARKIVFTDDCKVIRYAILDYPERYKIITGVDGAFAEIKLMFTMLDPFTYESEADKLVTVAGNEKQFVITNEAFECPAIFSLTNKGQSNVSGIALVVNGELASFSCTLRPGDTIVLDTNEYEVRFNDTLGLDYWKGEMPLLKNGDNTIYQSNAQSAQLLLTVEFTRQWV